MLEKVYSGLPYFYNWDETRQGILSCRIRVSEEVDCDILEDAVNEALEIHRHFKVRLVIENNNVYYAENEERARVYEGFEKGFTLIRDTQGYLFAFRVVKDMVHLDMFHLISDGSGVVAFCRTVTMLYFQKAHHEDWDAIMEKRAMLYMDDSQKVDPYTVDKVTGREKKAVSGSISEFLQLYDETDTEKCVNVKWNAEEYRQKCAVGAYSPYAVVNVLLGNIIEEQYGMQQQIGAYMPIDMRRRIGLKASMYNCLSYTNILHISEAQKLGFDEQCRAYVNSLKKYYGVSESLDIMSEDAKFIGIMQNEKLSIPRKRAIVHGVNEKTKKFRGTFGMSCIDFCKEDDVDKRYLKEIAVCPPKSDMGIVAEMVLLGNDVNLCIRYGSRYETVITQMVQRMREWNMDVSMEAIENLSTRIAIDSL